MNKERPEPPSDLELMMYFDGELEEPRKTAVAAFVGADLRARSKVAGLHIASAVVRDQAGSLSAADDIADLVMGKIAAETAVGPAPVIARLPPAAGPAAPQPIAAPPARAAANDNSRRLFVGLAGLVAVAAAALAVWSRQPTAPTAHVPSTIQTSPAASPSPLSVQPRPNLSASPNPEIDAASLSPEGESDHGVEVAAVNFGAHMGSIFYVPSGSIEAKRTTTVVWLAEDAGE